MCSAHALAQPEFEILIKYADKTYHTRILQPATITSKCNIIVCSAHALALPDCEI